jgi:hypothetical protein
MGKDLKPMIEVPDPTGFACKLTVFSFKIMALGIGTIFKSRNRFAMKQNKLAPLCGKWLSQIIKYP